MKRLQARCTTKISWALMCLRYHILVTTMIVPSCDGWLKGLQGDMIHEVTVGSLYDKKTVPQ